ncbi:SMODS domain-containing nucleotidyltransferase [Dyadobacter sp.]|uniref:SMODS domain-containing nucleotidyltransferase n=1 Tax=Dyadobacter sp. TaxID=1914288 RepID=UPI003F70662F
MPIPSYFNDFLKNIRLTSSQIDDLKTGHKTLRERLAADPELSKIIVSTFLQGSYRRSTATRPNNGKRADVDVIVVTKIDRHNTNPKEAIKKFIPFVEKHYKGKYEIQGRSIGIELSYVDLDIVVTSAPSEAEQSRLRSASVITNLMLEDDMEWKLVENYIEPKEGQQRSLFLLESIRKQADWKLEPLWIPDREANEWVETDPLEQIRWTREKNKSTNLHYINVVKAIKWWRVLKLTDLKYPKGYPIEHMIGDCCPDHITSVAQGITETFEKIISKYAAYRSLEIVPVLSDRGVPDHNVWKRVSVEDFNAFYDYVKDAAQTARLALDATTTYDKVKYWKILFGKAFPDAPEPSVKGGYSERSGPTEPSGGRFA